jgi:hypothetical protein
MSGCNSIRPGRFALAKVMFFGKNGNEGVELGCSPWTRDRNRAGG